jgi:predicted Rossmann fold nucleotide-binding protein DprA/Smf involved in DNA uptake
VLGECFSLLPAGAWFHHGDCIGADEQAHDIAIAAGLKVHIHPCVIRPKRANRIPSNYPNGRPAIEEPADPLERNRRMVNLCDQLFACPKEPTEVIRSGTWATIRYARKKGRRLYIILPHGEILG